THAVCTERNPVKEEEVYHRKSLDRLAAAGGYCLVSNHPDMNFATLREWVEGLPLDQAWHATAAEVAAWWRASHDSATLRVNARAPDEGATEIVAASREGVRGLVMRMATSAPLVAVDGARLLPHHPGEVRIALDIPAGETRLVGIREYRHLRRVAVVY